MEKGVKWEPTAHSVLLVHFKEFQVGISTDRLAEQPLPCSASGYRTGDML